MRNKSFKILLHFYANHGKRTQKTNFFTTEYVTKLIEGNCQEKCIGPSDLLYTQGLWPERLRRTTIIFAPKFHQEKDSFIYLKFQ